MWVLWRQVALQASDRVCWALLGPLRMLAAWASSEAQQCALQAGQKAFSPSWDLHHITTDSSWVQTACVHEGVVSLHQS